MFDKNNYNFFEGYIGSTGILKTSTNGCMAIVPIEKGKTYTVSHEFQTVDNRLRVALATANNLDFNTQFSNWGGGDDTTKVTLTSVNETFAYIYFSTKANKQEALDTLQIEEGTVATPYEPYGYKIPVNVRSKNLINPETINNLFLSGTNFIGSSTTRSFVIEMKDNATYTCNGDFELLNSNTIRIGITNDYPKIGVEFVRYNFTSDAKTFVNRNKYKYMCLMFLQKNTLESIEDFTNKVLSSFQLEEGEQATEYQPYYNTTTNIFLDQPLRKIDDVADCIDWKEGKVVRNIKEVVLDGSEDWMRFSNIPNPYFYISYVNKDKPYKINSKLFCNMLINKNMSQNYDYSMQIGNNYFLMTIIKSIQNVSDFKQWLSTNKPIVDYILATQTEETIELPEVHTTNGNNIITIDTKVKPSNVWIKYKSEV